MGKKEALFHQIMGGKDIFFSSFFNKQKAIKKTSLPSPPPLAPILVQNEVVFVRLRCIGWWATQIVT
jgi:hypothetical protein